MGSAPFGSGCQSCGSVLQTDLWYSCRVELPLQAWKSQKQAQVCFLICLICSLYENQDTAWFASKNWVLVFVLQIMKQFQNFSLFFWPESRQQYWCCHDNNTGFFFPLEYTEEWVYIHVGVVEGTNSTDTSTTTKILWENTMFLNPLVYLLEN